MKEDSVLTEVIARLEEWATWYSRNQSGGLGYPSTSLEYRLLRGGRTNRGTVLPPPASHPRAEEMEYWVVEMGQQNPLMARALRCHYFYPAPLRQQATRLAMSHTRFKGMLDMAHQWLAGRLSSM